MIKYNPKDWFGLIFQFHRSDTFRILLPTILLLGVLTAGLVYAHQEGYIHWKSTTAFHQILGFVLSMLLVFRINSAYDRWWEGRKLWGSLVNSSRSLGAKVHAYLASSHPQECSELLKRLGNFPTLLKDHLRSQSPSVHQPLASYHRLVQDLTRLNQSKALSTEQFLALNPEVTALMDITGACERIKNTPIPFSYGLFLKKVIFIYVVTTPFTFAIEYGYWGVVVVMAVFYAFASLELISEEVEDPFGLDANDLPLDELADKIRKNIESLSVPRGPQDPA